jgi:hypothetical protein
MPQTTIIHKNIMNQMVCKDLQNHAQNNNKQKKIECKWREKHKQKENENNRQNKKTTKQCEVKEL